MIEQLIATLLWSSTDDDGEFLDSGDYEVSPELIGQLEIDWQEFIDLLPEGFDADDHYVGNPGHDSDVMLAHDYILTRNHHGAGFWDGEWGREMGELLTKLAQRKHEIEVYVGDDGLLYA